MNLRPDRTVDLAAVTSMGVRLCPLQRQPTHTSSLFEMQATSAESNVLNVAASLGLRTRVLSKFVAGSPVAQFIKAELRRRNIECVGPEVAQDGPWGVRHQINIADSGFGPRGPRVWNDRAGEVGREIAPGDFDFDRLFNQDGCGILHLSGLFAALGPDTGRCCLDAARAAKAGGALVSFDLNHRASFWRGREDELRRTFQDIAAVADILVGNEEDFQLALGLEGPEAGGSGLAGQLDSFKEMIARARAAFPSVQVFATTMREVVDANTHRWGAVVDAGGEWLVEAPRPIQVLDRIGGGDSFVGGLLYAILKGWKPEAWLHFGWACGALAVTMLADYACPADEDQVWSVYHGNARVMR